RPRVILLFLGRVNSAKRGLLAWEAASTRSGAFQKLVYANGREVALAAVHNRRIRPYRIGITRWTTRVRGSTATIDPFSIRKREWRLSLDAWRVRTLRGKALNESRPRLDGIR